MMNENRPSVLLVEDDDDQKFLAERVLKKGGLTSITHIGDGVQAKDFLEHRLNGSGNSAALPDIVLMDLKLPGINGQEVLEWMATRSEFGTSLRYVLSSSGNPKDREQAEHTGIAGYFVKPLTTQDVERLKREFIERRK